MGGDPDQLNAVTSATQTRAPVLAASVAGASHEGRGMPCQDAFAIATYSDAFVLAVADGLGSAAHSDAGAKAAVEAATNAAVACAPDDPARAALEGFVAARIALEDLGAGTRIADFACTLMVVVVGTRIAIAHIGDGAVVGMRGDEPYVLSPPAPSEYVNEVDSLATDNWCRHVRCVVCVDGIDGIAAFTDGVQHAGLRRTDGDLEAHAGFFGPLFAYARTDVDPDEANERLAALLSGPKIGEHSDDDKTLVLVTLQ